MTGPQPVRSAAARARRTTRCVAVVVLAMAIAMAVVAAGGRSGGGPTVLGPDPVTVRVGIEHSRFLTDRVHVRRGTLVTFVVENRDPINHELIVGDEAVHARHRDGREAAHPPVPGEVSVAPGQTAVTTYRFSDPGTVRFACHLPRHLAYGMEGAVVVV